MNRPSIQNSIPAFILWPCCLIIVMALLNACQANETPPNYQQPPNLSEAPSDIAVKWANMTLYTFRFSSFNTPTYSSRSIGYLGLAMYESIVHGDPTHHTLSGQLNNLVLPAPPVEKSFHWILSLNAAQKTLLKLLYPAPGNSHRFIHERIDSLADAIAREHSADIDPEITERSRLYGETLAVTIYNWSLDDGGDKAYTRNFDPSFPVPTGDSYWVPPTRGQTVSNYPLHPHWGGNRTFVSANSQTLIPPIIPFSTDPASAYYKMYESVYQKDKFLTLNEREIAAWWGDDPTETFSPPGHSYYMATRAIEARPASLMTATEAYARVGMAVADAFINCWKIKYVYFNERPSSYVRKYIDPLWVQFWPEPPFPAFPSGHAMNSAAAATVLTELFGEPYAFTDQSHEGYRRNDDARFIDLTYPARSFTGFWNAANECAYSRFLGGIHTQQDNDVGQAEGIKVGENVNALQWKQ